MPQDIELAVKDPVVLLERIKKEFHGVTWDKYSFIDRGWDHQVIILDDSLVFRFPISSEYHSAFKNEVNLLEYLNSKINFPMPRYRYVAANVSFAGYAMVPGEALTREIYNQLETADKTLVSSQLAEFLSQLHLEFVEEIQQFNIPVEDSVADAHSLRADAEKFLRPKISKNEYVEVLKALIDIFKMVGMQSPRTLTHNDLSPKHILWDALQKKLGVIDFSDSAITDPAVDFAELFMYGQPFVRSVYEAYRGAKDDTFLQRAAVHHKRVGISTLIESLKTQMISFKDAKLIFDDAMKSTDVT